jgi:hypothetical protein
MRELRLRWVKQKLVASCVKHVIDVNYTRTAWIRAFFGRPRPRLREAAAATKLAVSPNRTLPNESPNESFQHDRLCAGLRGQGALPLGV